MGDSVSSFGRKKKWKIEIELNRKQANDKDCNNPIVYCFLSYLLFCMWKTKRRISYEYVVIDGVNNLKEDIEKLEELFKGKNIHINLIPLNPIEEFKYSKTKSNVMDRFQKKLSVRGLNATIRRSMGSDIDASCGQLRNNYAR